MTPVIVKVDDTWTPLRGLVISSSSGEPFAGLSGVAATFRLYAPDGATKLLQDEPASVEMDGDRLLAVAFTFTAAHWAALKAARPARLAMSGYSCEWRLTNADGRTWFVPRAAGLERVLLTLQAT